MITKKKPVHIVEKAPDGREYITRVKYPRLRIEVIDEVDGKHLKTNLKKAAAYLFNNKIYGEKER